MWWFPELVWWLHTPEESTMKGNVPMNGRWMMRATVAAVAAAAALIAAGCGVGKSATSSKGLDFIPKSSLMYVMVDTDFDGKNWKAVDDLGSKFDGWDAIRDQVKTSVEEGTASYKKDVKPWLGKHAGIGILSIETDGSDADFVAFLESTDDKKAEASLKSSKTEKAGELDGNKVYKQDAGFYWLVKDGVVVLAQDKKTLKKALKAQDSGDSVSEDDGAQNAVKELGDSSLLSFVIGTSGYASLRDRSNKQIDAFNTLGIKIPSCLTNPASSKAFAGAAAGLSADADGLHLHAIELVDKDALKDAKFGGKQFEPKLLDKVPADSVFAYTNMDLGGAVDGIVDCLKDNKDIADFVAQFESLAGLSTGDIADAYDGQFVLAAGPSQPGSFNQYGVSMMIENTGDATVDVTKKLTKLASLADITPYDVTTKQGSFQSVSIGGQTVDIGSNDDVAMITNDRGVVDGFGDIDSLADDSDFTNAVDAADMPDKVDGMMYLNPLGVAKLADASGMVPGDVDISAVTDQLSFVGPWLVWITTKDEVQVVDVFMQIKD